MTKEEQDKKELSEARITAVIVILLVVASISLFVYSDAEDGYSKDETFIRRSVLYQY